MAEIDGKIVGMWGINVIVHAGPVWVAPEWRGQGVSDAMGREVIAMLRASGARGYLMFPSHRGSELLAQRIGLRAENCKVYRGD